MKTIEFLLHPYSILTMAMLYGTNSLFQNKISTQASTQNKNMVWVQNPNGIGGDGGFD